VVGQIAFVRTKNEGNCTTLKPMTQAKEVAAGGTL
jgi:hypothetical protein